MRLDEVILRGLRSAQPSATAVAPGSLWCVTDEANVIERSNGTAWQTFGAAGGGDLVGPGTTVLDDAIIIWDGTTGALVQDSGITIAALITQALTDGASVFAPVPAEYNVGDVTGAKTISWVNGNHQRLRLTGDAVLTFSGGVVGASYRLIVAQDGTGGHGVTWPATVAFEDGVPPTLDTTAGGLTLGSFVYTAAGSGGYLGFCTVRTLAL
jgi:hypothetical protein